MATFYFIQFATNVAFVSVLIFIPLIAKDCGANSATIGALVAAYNGMLFLSSALFGRLADLKGGKVFILIGLFFSAVVFFSHRFVFNVPSLFLIRCLAGFAIGMFPAAILAAVYRRNSNIGAFTASGSLGWTVGSIVAGVIAVYKNLFLFSAICFFVSFFVALLFLKQENVRIKQPFFDTALFKKNWRIYLSFFLRHSGAFGIWTIFPLFLSQLGANKLWIGIIYGLNSLGQFFFMIYLGKVKSTKLIQMGLYFSIATFIAFGLCHTYKQILPFQLLLAFSWSCLYLGCLKYLMEHNKEHSSVAGIFNSLTGLAGIVGPLIGGLAGILGYPMVMFVAALMSIAGAFIKINP
ncbi:MAG: MFS transporter [bacterium]|nr:MFS transporter [bacterium]